MKRAQLLRTTASPAEFAELFTAMRKLGLRGGWLEAEEPVPAPESLETAASSGAFRAVGLGAGRVVTAKPVAGPPVVRDLLREHFAGCRLVIVRGAVDAPEIEPAENGWTIRFAAGGERTWTASGLARALRKPRLPGSASETAEPA